MPYRRNRRSYGRRRRYSRRQRRPNASRAVVRGTFAPRHQYLKLKAAFTHSHPAEAAKSAVIVMRIDNPYAPVNSFQGYTLFGDVVPLGWNAYANLFQRYVVHGCKVNCRLTYVSTTNTTNSYNWLCNWAVQTDNTKSTGSDHLRAMPISGAVTVSDSRPAIIKRYFNLSRIMGVQVAKHDRFYWEWGDVEEHHAFFRLLPYTSPVVQLEINWTLTWYISAVSSNAVAGDTAALAALKSFTVPFTGGEPSVPDAACISNATNTGFTTNPRALKHVGLGGTKRSASDE